MAPPTSFPGVGRGPRPVERLRRLMFNVVALGALAGAPVATVSLWLLLTDPALASEMAEGGLTFPWLRLLLITAARAVGVVVEFL